MTVSGGDLLLLLLLREFTVVVVLELHHLHLLSEATIRVKVEVVDGTSFGDEIAFSVWFFVQSVSRT